MDNAILQQHITPSVPYYLDTTALTGAASYTLTVVQRLVRLVLDATYLTTLVVPNACEMPNQTITFKVITTGAAGCHITDAAGTDLVGDDMTTAGDYVVLFSDGLNWFCLAELTT